MAAWPPQRSRRGAGSWALLLAGAWKARGWRTSGALPGVDRFRVYAGKFCFDSTEAPHEEPGKFEVQLLGQVRRSVAPVDIETKEGPPCWGASCDMQGNLYVMVFTDEEDHWAKACDKWHSLTCQEMDDLSSWSMPLQELDGEFNRTVFVQTMSGAEAQPRFWYFTFAACGIDVSEPIAYSIHAQNILQGIQSEFGTDERGSLELQLFIAFGFLGIGMCLRNIARRATGAEALRSRPLLRMLLLSALCSSAGGACLALHYVVFMFDGLGLSLLEVIGQVWVCGAKALLTLLQLLTAKGWALFYAPEEVVQRRLMMCIVCGVVLTSIACEIHADYFSDSSTALYLYESWPGLVILFLNVVLFAEAWRSMRETYRHETSQEVRVFYVVISLASLFYFLTVPAMCMLASWFTPWVRAKYIAQAEAVSRFIATLLLSFCLRPSRLDAMVNARLEDGLKTIGEERDDIEEEDRDIDGHEAQESLLSRHERDVDDDDDWQVKERLLSKSRGANGREASDDRRRANDREAIDDPELAACARGIVGPAE